MSPDDATYIGKVWDISKIATPFREGLYSFQPSGLFSATDALLSRPNAITDLIIGVVVRPFTSSPGQLGLLLDLVCVAISVGLFCRLYGSLAGSRSLASDLAAVITVVAPYLWIEGSQASIFSLFGTVMPVRYRDYDLPAFRAVYTQVSFCLFPLCLWPLVSLFDRNAIRPRAVWLSAAVSGSLVYVYFFAFISVSFLSFGLLLSQLFLLARERLCSYRESFKLVVQYIAVHLLVCSFGLAMLLTGSESGIAKSQEIENHFYFPWSVVAQTIIFLILSQRGRPGTSLQRYSVILFLCSCAEIVLPNLQPLLGQAIAPFHFHRFYSQPLFSGTFTLLVLTVFMETRRRLLYASVVTLISAISLIFHFGHSAFRIEGLGVLSEETSELFRFVKAELPREAILAVAPEPISETTRPVVIPLANMLVLETDRRVLFQHWCTDGSPNQEDVEREMLISYYFLGTPQPFIECRPQVSFPGDLFYLTSTAYHISQAPLCVQFDTVGSHWNASEVTKRYPTDYLISVSGMQLPTSPLERFRLIWKSSRGEYTVYSIRPEETF